METQNHSWESNCKAVNPISVNPMVSLCKKGLYAKVGERMEIVPLRQCMDICPLGCPRAPALSALLHAWNLHWSSVYIW